MHARGMKAGLVRGYTPAMLVVACIWFARVYCTSRQPYIDLARYAAGQERMPFQGRDLMRWPLLLAGHSAYLQRVTATRALLRSPEFLVMEVVAAISLLLAGWAAVKLYRLAAPQAPLPALPFALLVVICLVDFVTDVPFSFPYDLPATAFLGWGIYLIMRRRFWPLLPVFFFGTWNRETTLFLVGVLLLVAAANDGRVALAHVRFQDWWQAGVLLAVWLAITQAQKHLYAANPSEAGSRIAGNLHDLLRPILWPNILSVSAFLLPYVYLNRHRIRYAPLRASLLLLPFWLLLLLTVGQILEARIYGDISVLIAVAASLIVVDRIQSWEKVPATEGSERALAEA